MSRTNYVRYLILALCCLASDLMLKAQTTSFHNAPAYTKDLKPLAQIDLPGSAGRLYQRYCASCHGVSGQGSGNVPSLTTAAVKSASPGELFGLSPTEIPTMECPRGNSSPRHSVGKSPAI